MWVFDDKPNYEFFKVSLITILLSHACEEPLNFKININKQKSKKEMVSLVVVNEYDVWSALNMKVNINLSLPRVWYGP